MTVDERAGREKMTSFMEVRQMRHVSVLQRRCFSLTHLRRVISQNQQHGAEAVKVHSQGYVTALRSRNVSAQLSSRRAKGEGTLFARHVIVRDRDGPRRR